MNVNNEVEPQLKETAGSKQCKAATGSPRLYSGSLGGGEGLEGGGNLLFCMCSTCLICSDSPDRTVEKLLKTELNGRDVNEDLGSIQEFGWLDSFKGYFF